jgi:RNA polymerase-binding transcription factor
LIETRKVEVITHMADIVTEKAEKTLRTRNHSQIHKALLAQKLELTTRIRRRMGEVIVEREPDDEGAIAIDNYTKDLAAVTIERERRTLNEINGALARIEAGDYGVCGFCGTSIPKVRLEALPWARLCVNCAERNAA